MYHSVFNNDNCNDDYIGEIARGLKEKVKDHNGHDKSSHLIKHSIARPSMSWQLQNS